MSRPARKNFHITESEEHIYFDVELSNPLADGVDDADAVYDQSFNQNILNHPHQYKMTIARMNIPASEIPLFLGLDDTYSITLEYDGSFFEQALLFSASEISNGVRTVNSLLEKINEAFDSAFTALNAAFPGAPPSLAPLISYDNATKQLVHYVEDVYNEDIAGAPTILIWYNTPLYHLLGVLHSAIVNIPEASNGRGLNLLVPDLGNNFITAFRYPGGTTANTLEVPQTQGMSLNVMGQLTNIIITSNSFKTRPQYENRVNIINASNFDDPEYVEKNVLFDLAIDSGEYLTEKLLYIPALYRWIDMLSNNGINRVQFQVFYKLNTGQIIPLKIGVGRALSVKFLFQKIGMSMTNTNYKRSNEVLR